LANAAAEPITYRTTPGTQGVTTENHIFARLMAVIEDRRANPPPKSYTTALFAGGVPKIGEKITEEAAEVVEAAAECAASGTDHLVHEAADLVYHLFVMLGHCGVSLGQVEGELARRFGISGIDEKAARPVNESG
jgi:phosphoribosyl-ATP pyrophosphohydrolase